VKGLSGRVPIASSPVKFEIFLSTVAYELLRGGLPCSCTSQQPDPASFFSGQINRLDSLFDRVFGDDGGFMRQSWPSMPLAMWEDDDHLYIEAELPGVSENDVEVTFHNGSLFIPWRTPTSGGSQVSLHGQTFGRFERVVTLPEAVNTDAVEATLSNGIFASQCPRAPKPSPRRSC